VPNTLYEYLPTRRPILAVTPRDSAVWRIAETVPQLFTVDAANDDDPTTTVTGFLKACRNADRTSTIPETFTESQTS
jgi:hypothetical protein